MYKEWNRTFTPWFDTPKFRTRKMIIRSDSLGEECYARAVLSSALVTIRVCDERLEYDRLMESVIITDSMKEERNAKMRNDHHWVKMV